MAWIHKTLICLPQWYLGCCHNNSVVLELSATLVHGHRLYLDLWITDEETSSQCEVVRRALGVVWQRAQAKRLQRWDKLMI